MYALFATSVTGSPTAASSRQILHQLRLSLPFLINRNISSLAFIYPLYANPPS